MNIVLRDGRDKNSPEALQVECGSTAVKRSERIVVIIRRDHRFGLLAQRTNRSREHVRTAPDKHVIGPLDSDIAEEEIPVDDYGTSPRTGAFLAIDPKDGDTLAAGMVGDRFA